MADDFTVPGTADTATPESPPPSPQDAALGALAKDDDATRYIEERQSQEDEGQEPERPTNGDGRADRIEQSLEQARERSRQARETESQLDQNLDQAEREWQQQEQQEQAAQQQYANTLAYHEARGMCMARAEQLKATNPALHKTISDNLMLLESVLDPDQAKVIEMALVYHPAAIWKLGENLSNDDIKVPGGETMADKIDLIRRADPQELARSLYQGIQQFQQEAIIQQRIYQDRIEQGRRFTKAPPPIVPPRGTASVPKDMYRTAQKADASDYIKMRRAQMARDEKE
jgi:hypothetical protein